MRRTMAAIGVGITGAAVAVSVASAGTADAQTKSHYVGMNCVSLNPNILDIPYMSGIDIRTDTTEPGRFDIFADSKSIFPYTTDSTVTTREVATGKVSVYHRHWTHGFDDTSGYQILNIPGHGRIDVTLTATSHGLIPNLPAPVCRGSAVV